MSFSVLLFTQTTFTSVSRVCPFCIAVNRSAQQCIHVCTLPDTLIVWTEPDGIDYALSFQDPEGCSEVWNFIAEVQQHMNSVGVSFLTVCVYLRL